MRSSILNAASSMHLWIPVPPLAFIFSAMYSRAFL